MLYRVLKNTFGTLKPQVIDIVKNYNKVSSSQRLQLVAKKCKLSVTDAEDGNNISQLSDLTSFSALLDIRQRMLNDPVGRQILEEKPRITDLTINSLKDCKQGTFGKGYHNFMSSHGFHPHQRPIVKYIPDLQLAYVLQRYKQIHDFLHVLLLKQISINDELIVKWFEMTQLKLPSTSLAAIVSPFMMGPIKAYQAFKTNIPETVEKAKKCKFIMNIYFEKHFDQNLEQFKREIGLIK